MSEPIPISPDKMSVITDMPTKHSRRTRRTDKSSKAAEKSARRRNRDGRRNKLQDGKTIASGGGPALTPGAYSHNEKDDVFVRRTRTVVSSTTSKKTDRPSQGVGGSSPSNHQHHAYNEDDSPFFYGDEVDDSEEWSSSEDEEHRIGAVAAGPEGHRRLTKGQISIHPGHRSFDNSVDSVDSETVFAIDGGNGQQDHRQRPPDEQRSDSITDDATKRRWIIIAVVAGIVIAVIIAIVVAVIVTGSDGESPTIPGIPDDDDTNISFTQREATILKSLEYLTTDPTVYEDPKSPQYVALKWLANEDEALIDDVDQSQLEQRFALAVLYLSTPATIGWKDSNQFMSSLHECNWTSSEGLIHQGITCDSSNKITRLQLGKLIYCTLLCVTIINPGVVWKHEGLCHIFRSCGVQRGFTMIVLANILIPQLLFLCNRRKWID